jgi:hypothetical protein
MRKVFPYIFALIFLGLGFVLLVMSRRSFNVLGFNRSLGYPSVVSYSEITFWPTITGVEIGLIFGYSLTIWKRDIGPSIFVLNIIIWSEFLANIVIIYLLALSGALL